MYCFFNTPKQKDMLLSEIEESDFTPDSKSLKRLYATSDNKNKTFKEAEVKILIKC